jgi:hypothetical protein
MEKAQHFAEEALHVAERLDDAARLFGGHVALGTALFYSGRILRICEEHRIQNFHGLALCENGWALSATGESEEGLAQIAQGADGYGLGANQHMQLTLQADAQLAIGKPEAALASVAAGLKAVEKTGGAPLEAELHGSGARPMRPCSRPSMSRAGRTPSPGNCAPR